MRLAISGTHGSGKTSLIEDLASARPHYETVAEPYWLLAAEGRHFSGEPSLADFEEQLEASCSLILAGAGQADVVFDRSPLDFIAYLEVIGAAEGIEWIPHAKLLPRIEKALSRLDLIVFLPLTVPDEIDVPIELPRLRQRVDARLKSMLRTDDLGLLEHGPRVVEISGTRADRLARVLAELDGR